jgi:hypothetical protein
MRPLRAVAVAAATLALTVAAASAAPPAKKPKGASAAKAAEAKVTFRMQPPHALSWIETVRGSSLARTGSQRQTAIVEIRSRKTLDKTAGAGGGFTLTLTQLGLQKRVNKQKDPNPPEGALDNITLTFDLDADGRAKHVRGYEPLEAALHKVFPRTAGPALHQLAEGVSQADEQQRLKMWNDRVGVLAGRTAELGKPLGYELEVTGPSGETIKVHGEARPTRREKCGDAECVRLEFAYDSDAAALKSFATSESGLAWVSGRPSEPTKSDAVEVNGGGWRLVDPQTLIIHGELEERTVCSKDAVAQEKYEYSVEEAAK